MTPTTPGPNPLPPAVPPTWQPGAEPIAGYRLIEPLGHGGFGQVWKCEAPGGLHKAIKIVGGTGLLSGDGTAAAQEFEALHLLKAVRHPFILSLDRVEVDNGALLVVMELAERSLGQVSQEYQQQGKPGIPRDDLLRFLTEVAEALDWMSFEHGLQHLDVKPDNLFLVCDHVKIADFGLVHSLSTLERPPKRTGGFTPAYASPEIWRGAVSPYSDQYSLAVVFLQLLTGELPFSGKKTRELMLKHLNEDPNLNALTSAERPIVARALAKDPAQRFPSCLDFMKALANAAKAQADRQSGLHRTITQAADVPEAVSQSSATGEKSTRTLRRSAARSLATADSGNGRNSGDSKSRARASIFEEEGRNHRAAEANGVDDPYLLPGYQRDRCLSQGPLGDFWRLTDGHGGDKRGLWPLNADIAPETLTLLRALKHPALPRVETLWDLSGRVVLVTDMPKRTLRLRYDECRTAGVPGIPRQELLGYLRVAAEALDTLAGASQLRHLNLNPNTLLLDGEKVLLGDFGLADLLGVPGEVELGEINSRYAAPELFADDAMESASAAADQYSLAIIYAEMLSGVRVRARPAVARSRARTGHRVEAAAPNPVNLDLLPAFDRPALTKALNTDPKKRFSSCTELLTALDTAGSGSRTAGRQRSLSSVLPSWRLTGESAPETGRPVPGVRKFLEKLAGDANVFLPARGTLDALYVVHDDGTWESRYQVQMFAGALELKLHGFCQQWHAHQHTESPTSALLTIDLARGFWDVWKCRQPRLEIHVDILAPKGSDRRRSEAQVRLKSVGERGDGAARVLEEMGPQVLESLRSYLLATADQRTNPRLAYTAPLHIYPILPDEQFGELIQATTGNISATGAGLRLARPLPSDRLYLHWYNSPTNAAHALLGRVIRCVWTEGVGYDVGVIFQ